MRQSNLNISTLISNPAKFAVAFFGIWLAVHFLTVLAFSGTFETQLFISRFFLVGFCLWGGLYLYRELPLYFTAYSSPLTLAIFRIVFYGFVSIGATAPLYLFDIVEVSYPWIAIPIEQRVSLPYMGWYIQQVPLTPLSATIALKTIAISSFCCMVGFRVRFFSILFLVATFYFNGFPNFFGKVNHNHYIIWFAAILCFARCSDALSLDNWMKRNFGAKVKFTTTLPLNYYRIPLAFIALLIGIIYFFPGFHKVWNGGLYWAFSDNLKIQLFLKALETGSEQPLFYVRSLDFPLQVAAFFTIVFELVFLFFITSKKHKWIAMLGGILFHTTTYIFLQINFFYLLVCYVVFIDWERIFLRLGQKIQSGGLSLPASYLHSRALMMVGGTLLTLNVLAGVFKVNSWPISCFPPFEHLVGNETSELKFCIRNKHPLDKEKMRQKFSAPIVRQWEYKVIENLLKNDTAAIKADFTNIYHRMNDVYVELMPTDTVDIYLVGVTIKDSRWASTGNDSLVYSYVRN